LSILEVEVHLLDFAQLLNINLIVDGLSVGTHAIYYNLRRLRSSAVQIAHEVEEDYVALLIP
jgi:hypothetical protein